MLVKCPKCDKEGYFVWLGEPDTDNIVAMVRHSVGTKTVTDFYTGQERIVDDIEMHFLALNQIDHLEWFKRWKEEKDECEKKHNNEMDKLYSELYWRDERERIAKEQAEEDKAREKAIIEQEIKR